MPRRASIRTLLLRLVLAVALPLAGLEAWILYATAQADSRQAYQQVFHLAQVTASDTAKFLDQVQKLLDGLAARPAVRALDSTRCDPILTDLLGLAPRFANVITAAIDGRVVCSAVPLAAPTRVDPARFLKRMRGPDQLTMGQAAPGSITGRWVVPVGRPLLDAQGAIVGAVVLPIDLARFPVLPSLEGLPAHAIVGLIDGEGTVLARSIDAQRFVGTKAGAGRTALREKSGTAEVTGIDGIARIQGFASVPGTAWIAVASLPASTVHAGVNARIATSAMAGLAILIAALLLALRWSRQIHDPIRALADTAGKVAAGNLAARALVAGSAEIAEVAAQFNRMLDARDLAESDLRRANERYSLALSIGDVWDWDLSTNRVSFPQGFWRRLGYDPDEVGDPVAMFESVLHPEDIVRWRKEIRDHVARRAPYEWEYRVRTKSGEYRWFFTHGQALWDGTGRATRMAGTAFDITARKQTEAALRESEERFRSLAQLSSDYYWEQDEQFRFVERFAYFPEERPYPRELAIGKTRWELPATNMTEADWAAHRAQLAAHKEFRGLEIARPGPDGQPRWISTSGHPIFDRDGVFRGYRGVGTDITERKRTEQLLALEKSVTQQFSEISDPTRALRGAIQAICESEQWECGRYLWVDAVAGLLRFGEAWGEPNADVERYVEGSRAMVYAPGVGLVGKVWQSRQPLWVPDAADDPRTARPGFVRAMGIRAALATPVIAEGRVIGVLIFSSRQVREPDAHLLQTIQLISGQIGQFVNRARAEQGLRERERLLSESQRIAHIGSWRWDMTGPIVWSDETYRIYGVSPDRFTPTVESLISLIHPEDRALMQAWISACMADEKPGELVFRIIRSDGEVCFISGRGELMRNAENGSCFMAGTAQDISERMRISEALQGSEEKYRGLIETMSEGLGMQDQDGLITFLNNRACEMLGYRQEELIGKPATSLFDERNLEILREQMSKRRQGVRQSYEIAWTRKDGTTMDTIMSPRPIYHDDGSFAGSVAVFTDITERKRAESTLRAYTSQLRDMSRRLLEAQETERRNINRELHDRIGQNLSALNLELRLIRSVLSKDSLRAAATRLDDAQKLLEATTAQVRDVMADLHPAALDDYGLFAALRGYAASFSARVNLPVAVNGSDLATCLTPAVEMALFRIAQEALANAAKHARAKRVEVTLAASAGMVTLTVSDDGVGFDVASTGTAHPSWGLSVMHERADAAGATLRVESAPGSGTRVIAEVAPGTA